MKKEQGIISQKSHFQGGDVLEKQLQQHIENSNVQFSVMALFGRSVRRYWIRLNQLININKVSLLCNKWILYLATMRQSTRKQLTTTIDSWLRFTIILTTLDYLFIQDIHIICYRLLPSCQQSPLRQTLYLIWFSAANWSTPQTVCCRVVKWTMHIMYSDVQLDYDILYTMWFWVDLSIWFINHLSDIFV